MLYRAAREGDRDQAHGKKERRQGGLMQFRRKPLSAVRAEVKEPHRHGQKHAAQAVIDAHRGKTAYPCR